MRILLLTWLRLGVIQYYKEVPELRGNENIKGRSYLTNCKHCGVWIDCIYVSRYKVDHS